LGYVLAIADSGCDPFRRTNEMLCPFVSLLACEQRHAARIESDELPPEVMIGDVPSWAFDVYSREGRAALARFLELMCPLLDGYGATSARRADSHSSAISSSGSRAGSSRWPLADELRRQADVECSGPDTSDDTQILELMRDDLPLLNEAKVAVMGAPRG
jgi:hypothetical protein